MHTVMEGNRSNQPKYILVSLCSQNIISMMWFRYSAKQKEEKDRYFPTYLNTDLETQPLLFDPIMHVTWYVDHR